MNISHKSKISLLIFSTIGTLYFYSYASSSQSTNKTEPEAQAEVKATPHEPPSNHLLIDDLNDIEPASDTSTKYSFDIYSFDDLSNDDGQITETPSIDDGQTTYKYSFDPMDDPEIKAAIDKAKVEQQKYEETTKQVNITTATIAQPELSENSDVVEIPLADTQLRVPEDILNDMPPYISNYLKTIVIKDISLILGSQKIAEGIMFSGIVYQNNAVVKMSDGRPLKGEIVIVEKTATIPGGYAAFIELPTSWKPSQCSTDLSSFDRVTFKNPIIIISSFLFTNKKADYTIEPGVNVITEINPATLVDSTLYNIFVGIDKQLTTTKIATLVLNKTPFLKISIFGRDTGKPSLKITDYINVAAYNIPAKIATNLTNFALRDPRIDLIIGSNIIGQSIKFSGIGTIFGKDVKTLLTIKRKSIAEQTPTTDAIDSAPDTAQPKKTKMVTETRLYIKLPQGWSFADVAPAIQNNLNIAFENPLFILSSHDDEKLTIQKGLTFQATVKLANVPPILQDFKDLLSSVVDRLIVSGLISNDDTSKLKFELPLQTILLTKIVNVDELEVPSTIKTDLKNCTIQKPKIEISITAQGQKALLMGTALFQGTRIPIKAILQRKSGKLGASIAMTMPTGWKISNISPDFESIDAIALKKTTLILSTITYNDDALNVTVEPGLNIIAKAQLPEALKPLTNLYESMAPIPNKQQESTPTEQQEIIFKSVIKPNIKESAIALVLPGSISVSLNALPGISKIITSIKISNPIIAIKPGSQEFKGGATVTMTFPSLQQPLETSASLIVQPEALGIEITRSAIKPKFWDWLELSDAGFKIVLAGEIPTDIEVYGGMVLNNDPIAFALKFGHDGSAITGNAANLSLASMAALFTKMSGVSIPMDKVPSLGIKDAELYIVPIATTVGEKELKPGATIKGTLNILDMQGTLDCSLNLPGTSRGPVGIAGTATMSKITNPIFTLQNMAGDAGPIMSLIITRAQQQAKISGKATVTIPGLNANATGLTDILISPKGINFTLGGSILGFDAQYNFVGTGSLTKLSVNNLALTISLAQSATDAIKANFTKAADVIKQEADKKLGTARMSMETQKQQLQSQLNQKRTECGF